MRGGHRAGWLSTFLVAVLLIITAVNIAVGAVIMLVNEEPVSIAGWFAQPLWLVVSLATLLVIVIGSIWRMHQLRQGGDAIAEWSGATRLDMHSQKQRDRVFINVAEEMAIASGMPMPSLWVLEREAAINAFVAGLQPSEAALVVTRGCLEQLDRDELQGVIGHEFSHIFHGDMRLNVRLMGILAGILAIGQVGGFLLRSTGAGVSRRRSGANVHAIVLASGISLLVIGYVGLFFGRLIKASVSRQREYLADASAVQYTRSTKGIAGALAKIGGFAFGSNLAGARAEEMSHMCFGETVRMSFGGLLATHPPLNERIERIDPHFDIKARSRERAEQAESQAAANQSDALAASMGFTTLSQDVVSVNAAEVVESVGNPTPAHISYAHALHSAIPDAVAIALHATASARLAVMAMLLGNGTEYIEKRRQIIAAADGADAADKAVEYALLKTQWERLRLAVVDLALPQLKQMPADERRRFMHIVRELVSADGRVSLFEFTLLAVLRRHLPYKKKKKRQASCFSFYRVEREIALMLSLVIRVGGDKKEADERYARLLRTFTRTKIDRESLPGLSGKSLTAALDKLQTLVPILKSTLIEALVECVIHDGHISIKEAEILRAISETLDCPLPPLINAGTVQT